MEKSRTYHGLLHVLVREKTVYLWACSVDGNYNLDSDEILWLLDSQTLMPGGELPYEEYMEVCHELGSYFQEKIPKRVCQFFTKIPERAIISVRNSR